MFLGVWLILDISVCACEHTLQLTGSLSFCRERDGWERGRKWSKGENTKLLTLNSTVNLSVTWDYFENILSNQAYISTWPFIHMYPKIYFWKPTLSSSENSRQYMFLKYTIPEVATMDTIWWSEVIFYHS